jgi:hypothetical protein
VRPRHESAQANESTRIIVEAATVLRRAGLLGGITAAAREERTPTRAPSASARNWYDELCGEYARASTGGIVWPMMGMWFLMQAWVSGFDLPMAGQRR